MSAGYTPQVGDRVRVVLEADVSDVDGEGVEFDSDEISLWIGPKARRDFVVSIEKIEPPVEVFGPGDVVRAKTAPDYHFMLGKGEYLNKFGSRYPCDADEFTSKDYERVALS